MANLPNEVLEESERRHHNFMSKMFFSGSKNIHGANLYWHDNIKDYYSNFAGEINTHDPNKLLMEIKSFYKSISRNPSVFTTPFTRPDISSELKSQGFELKFNESWMFLADPKPVSPKPEFSIISCTSMDYIKMFTKTLNIVYSSNEVMHENRMNNSDYSEAIIESFHSRNDGRSVKYFVGLMNGMPVSTAMIAYDESFGGIYRIGTVPEMRSKGLGSMITMHCVSELKKAGVKFIFLQTETGSYNEEFYKKLGFVTEFKGQGWIHD